MIRFIAFLDCPFLFFLKWSRTFSFESNYSITIVIYTLLKKSNENLYKLIWTSRCPEMKWNLLSIILSNAYPSNDKFRAKVILIFLSLQNNFWKKIITPFETFPGAQHFKYHKYPAPIVSTFQHFPRPSLLTYFPPRIYSKFAASAAFAYLSRWCKFFFFFSVPCLCTCHIFNQRHP